MTNETLDLMHRSYQDALMQSSNILEIVENLYKILANAEIPSEDIQAFDSFYDGLRHCLQYRRKTFYITNMIISLNTTLMYIVLWLNTNDKLGIDINWYSRRKSLESDLTKLLFKSDSNLSVNIRDRFGLRGVLYEDSSPQEAIEKTYAIFEAIKGIIAGKNRQKRKEFENWYTKDSSLSPLDKTIIKHVLDIPFSIDFLKDYINSPKENGYQTLQFTMSIPMYSSILPGCQLEVQLRTLSMHNSAMDDEYKVPVNDYERELQQVFTVDNFSEIHIPGFRGYGSPDEDIDGIHFPKMFFNRRISPTLVPF